METQQLQQLKINSTNIKSSLISYNKQLRKLRLDENKLLVDREKKSQALDKEKKLETPGKGLIENIKSRIIAGPMSFFDKVKEFFGIILIGIAINNLPAIVSKVSEVGKSLIDVANSVVGVITTTVNGVNGFISIIQSLPETTKNKLIEGKNQLEQLILDMNKIIDPLNEQYTKFNKDLNSKSGGTPNSRQSGQPNPQSQKTPQGKAKGGTISNIPPGSGRGSPTDKANVSRGTADIKVTSSPYARPGGSPKLKQARQSYNAFQNFYDLTKQNKENYTTLEDTTNSFDTANKSVTEFLIEIKKLYEKPGITPSPPTPANQSNPPTGPTGQTYTTPSGSGVPSQTEAYRGRGINPPQGVNNHGYPARDYPVSSGLPISVMIPGEVVFAGSAGNYGNLVEIKHVTGQITRYAHLSQIKVKVGDKVEDGKSKLIGYSGGAVGAPGAGNSQGPHLHFEMVDPTGKTYMDYNTGDSFFRFLDTVPVKVKKGTQTSSLLDPINQNVALNKNIPSRVLVSGEEDEGESEVQMVAFYITQPIVQQGKTRTVMVNSGRKDPFPSESPSLAPLPGIWNPTT